MLHFIQGRKHQTAVYNGHQYTFQRENADKTVTYICIRRRQEKCLARIRVRASGEFTGPVPEHNHEADHGRTAVAVAVDDIRIRAKGTAEPTVRVVGAAKRKLNDEALVYLPKDESLKRIVKRARTKLRPREPKTIDDVEEVDVRYVYDADGDHWLLGDNKGRNRVLVFCTKENLRRLTQSSYLIMDGTFKVVPDVFSQLYVIHAYVHGIWAPQVFALMKNKNKASYQFLFRTLTGEARRLLQRDISPAYVGVDFESTVIDLIPEFFPQSSTAGCLFHLTQIWWRILAREGLVSKYKDEGEENFRSFFRAACGLALVPVDDVVECFGIWKRDAPRSLAPLITHIENYYVLGKRWGRGRRPPKYPPALWNCRERVQQNRPRTSNTAEGWNNRIRVVIGKHHPSFYQLLEEMKAEMKDAKQHVLQHAFGRSPPKKRLKWTTVDRQIERMVDNYDQYKVAGTQLEFMKGVGHNLAGRFASARPEGPNDDEDDNELQPPPSASPQRSQPPSPPCSSSRDASSCDRRWISQHASEKGLRIKDNAGGGDCLFYALQDGLREQGRDYTVRYLRNQAHRELSERSAYYRRFFVPPTENERGAAKTFEEFVTRTKTSEWGTELTIMALAKTLNIKITTLMAAIRMTNSFGDGETEVSVGHINDESHYVALLPNPT